MILITLVIIVCWDFTLVLPIKILVVFLHELSHGVAAILTGGTWESFSLVIHQGGHALVRGGNFFIIASAGYLGSLFFGVLLFVAAVRTNWDRLALALLGGVMIGVALILTRDMFPLIFCLVFGVCLLVVARYAGRIVSDLLLRIFGLVSMIYVPYDIYSDTIARSHIRSDARIIAEFVGGPTIFWGGLWLVISAIVIILTARLCLRSESNLIKANLPRLRS